MKCQMATFCTELPESFGHQARSLEGFMATACVEQIGLMQKGVPVFNRLMTLPIRRQAYEA